MSTTADEGPSAWLTLGRLLDARLMLDEQTFDALDDQHRRLAVRVEAVESAVATLEELLLGSSALPGVPGPTGQARQLPGRPGAKPEHGKCAGSK